MEKPNLILQIETQIQSELTQLPQPADLSQAARHKNNRTYVLDDQGKLLALNVTGADGLKKPLTLGEEAAALQYLVLGENKNLAQLTFQTPLPDLKYLDLSECSLTELAFPAGFEALEMAYLQKNKLQKVDFKGGCSKLLFLDLSQNQLEELALPGGFDTLEYLYLGNNRLLDLIFYEPLPPLNTLHLIKNQLRLAPQEVVFLKTLQQLYLAGNSPKNIPKVFLGKENSYRAESCLQDALAWFAALRDAPHEKNKVVKLMLTGNGNAGKSTLFCALKNGACSHDHASTHGIQIETLEWNAMICNVWDFGGQEVYHGTHRLFLASECLQVIVFDPETETTARQHLPVKDRIRGDSIFNHPVEYWHETTKALSQDSLFFIVQNKKDQAGEEDARAKKYAEGKARFVQLSAKTGAEVDDLAYFLQKDAKNLPDYDMLMPQSWLRVRQFFMDNLGKPDNRKVITKNDFAQLCGECKVKESNHPLLFRYLHHNGFLYHHENLGEKIIADQRWALEAIYKPLDRQSPHYEEFRDDLKGQIRVRHIFEVFGREYLPAEKWLFLDFMKSCGLCFQLNNKPWQENRSENDIYVFPEFLPAEKPAELTRDWQRAEDVRIFRYRMPWFNYPVIQSFISAVGRKTGSDKIWRNGIHVSTPEGWFKVELDEKEPTLLLFIEAAAMQAWLKPILEEIKIPTGNKGWEFSEDGAHFQPFDPANWENRQKEKPNFLPEETLAPHEDGKKASERLKDVPQEYHKKVILFLAANPTASKLSLRPEHSHIAEVLAEKNIRGKFDLVPSFGTSPDRMNEAIDDCNPSIVHFCGHGKEQDPDSRKGGGLAFHSDDSQDEKVLDAEKLGKLFQRIKKTHPQLLAVLLNACYSEPQAAAISQSGMFAVGTSDEVHSLPARLFAAGFYRKYALTDDVKKSVDFGLRQALTEDEHIEGLVHLFHNGQKISV